MTGQRPVYRYAPRSHVYNCPCSRCVQVRSRRTAGGDLIAFDLGCLGVAAIFLVIGGIGAGITWLVKHPGADGHAALEFGVPAGILAVSIWAVVYFNRHERNRPLPTRLPVGAVPPTKPPAGAPPRPKRPSPSLPIAPQRPLCQHVNAEPVKLSTGETVAWVCPDCPAKLSDEFGDLRRPCCRTVHGTLHLIQCPYFSEWAQLHP